MFEMESRIKGPDYSDYARRLREFSDIVAAPGVVPALAGDREATSSLLLKMVAQVDQTGSAG